MAGIPVVQFGLAELIQTLTEEGYAKTSEKALDGPGKGYKLIRLSPSKTGKLTFDFILQGDEHSGRLIGGKVQELVNRPTRTSTVYAATLFGFGEAVLGYIFSSAQTPNPDSQTPFNSYEFQVLFWENDLSKPLQEYLPLHLKGKSSPETSVLYASPHPQGIFIEGIEGIEDEIRIIAKPQAFALVNKQERQLPLEHKGARYSVVDKGEGLVAVVKMASDDDIIETVMPSLLLDPVVHEVEQRLQTDSGWLDLPTLVPVSRNRSLPHQAGTVHRYT